MKLTLPSIFTTLAILAVPAFAAEPGSGEMMQMYAHMQAMQDTLHALDAEQDPGKHAALMAQHMQQMQQMRESMQMMAGGAAEHAAAMSAEQRMAMMERHMEMMQGMMGQMMDHMREQGAEAPANAAPAHEHATPGQ